MKMKKILKTMAILVLVFIGIPPIFANGEPQERYFVGTSAFILANVVPNQTNPPDFFQLNFGYWLTGQDVIAVEMLTWKYNRPLGIPYGNSYEDPNESYPGYIREFGIGFAYQRYLWKRLYSALHATNLYQRYVDQNKETIQTGYRLFLTLRLGYHLGFFNNRFFIEPSLACTSWPVTTNMPQSFKGKEEKWPKYFLFEPGLHLGYKF